MKKNLQFLVFCFCLTAFNTVIAQVYVNQNATGLNNGSSWNNAYVNLDDALESSSSDDIWVATGTYFPAGGTPTSSFFIDKSVKIYGGFNGTETMLSQRDITANSTILSGDHLGNDTDSLEGLLDTISKQDNSLHVIYIDSLVEVTIDGFRISEGFTSDNPDAELSLRAGGGIFTYSTIHVNNCLLTNNFGRSGACVYVAGIYGGADNSSFENLSVRSNRTSSQSAGIFVGDTKTLTIKNSEFVGNSTVRGALYPLRNDGITISNCSFRENNAGTGNFGGAMFSWNNKNMTIENCEFLSNKAGSGGVMYIDGREDVLPVDNILINNCTFTSNEAISGFGGALNVSESSFTLTNCTFDENRATGGSGGAIYTAGNTSKEAYVLMEGNTITNSFGSFGGACTFYNNGCEYTIKNNTFDSNIAATSGGATINGFGSNVIYENNTFIRNSARFGGAMATQNNGVISLKSCNISENSTSDNAGALNIINHPNFVIDDCKFELNIAEMFGGVISASGDSIIASLVITNTEFSSNTANLQGAALNISNMNTDITSSVFGSNSNNGTGYGGAISVNGTSGNTFVVNIINSTIAENFAQFGAGLAAYTDGAADAEVTINLGNTILSQTDGLNYELEDGTPTIISLGGNYSTDDSTDPFFTSTNDVSDGKDVRFEDELDLNFRLEGNSPALNIGIESIAPTLDIEGSARFGLPDAGAYEYQFVSINETILENNGFLTILQNPIADILNFEIVTPWKGQIQVDVVGLKGSILASQTINKTEENQQFSWNVESLNSGFYFLVVRANNEALISKLVKI